MLIPRKVFDKIGLPYSSVVYDFSQQAYKKGFKIYRNYDAALYTCPKESGEQQNRWMKSIQNYHNHFFWIEGEG